MKRHMMSRIINALATLLLVISVVVGNAQAATQVTYYHHDALGSVIATSNEAGVINLNEEYQPYGEKIYQTVDTENKNEDWYTGKNYDKELDLTYFGARWYDAKQGRFLSIDPVSAIEYMSRPVPNIHGFNRYSYGNNNPYRFIDPDGREVKNPHNYDVHPHVMKSLEDFNNYIGKNHDVVITGGNRSKGSKLGAKSNSQHSMGTAADFKVPGTTHLEAANAALKSKIFSGVGWYEEGYIGPNGEGPHVHGDLRLDRSKENPAQWGYAKDSKKAGRIPPYEGEPTLTVNKQKND